jgi:asparagine synthase (glutamine-hydrolysing)
MREKLAYSHRSISGEVGMILYALSLSNKMRRSYNIATSDIWLRSQLFNNDLLGSSQDPCAHFQSVFSDADADQYFDAWLHTDLMSRMQEYTVVQPDISGMAYGLEIRAPFLDHELIQFAGGLAPDLKIKQGRITKYLLRRALDGLIPDEIVNRHDKTGFSGVTYAHLIGLAQGRWRRYFEDSLFAGTLQACGYFHPKFIEHSWQELLVAKPRSADATLLFQTIWSLVVFEHWWREMVTS